MLLAGLAGDLAAKGVHEALHDREAKPRAKPPRIASPRERLEDMRNQVPRHPGAVIRNREDNLVVEQCAFDPNVFAPIPVSVCEEIREHLFEAVWVGEHANLVLYLNLDRLPLWLGSRLERPLDRDANSDGLQPDLSGAALQFGQVKQVFDECTRTLALSPKRIDRLLDLLRGQLVTYLPLDLS